ncbi:C40 family peptidase [Agrococcus jejuensis]|uniref:C40 family peptidase n=1 Tax=Agrococcus jejuensis TaxID=399736 RepID=UPI0011A35E3A|nr:C40 family peptidase [Agrococcus jejuensis]
MQQSTTSTEIVAQPTPRTTTGARRSMAKRVGVAAVAIALFGTVALPAAALQSAQAQPAVLDGSIAELLAQTQQQVEVQQSPLVESIAENGLAATTPEQLAQAQAEAAAAEAARQEAEAAAVEAASAAPVAAAATPAAASSSVASASSGSIVGIAQSQLGVPYVWGGASPSTGFDCSGFTQWVYGQVGVYLPHSDRGQLGYGTPVAVSDIQPGDLVIWNGHTAIYVGGDSIIHAATAGKPVKYSSFSGMVAAMGTPQVRRF